MMHHDVKSGNACRVCLVWSAELIAARVHCKTKHTFEMIQTHKAQNVKQHDKEQKG